ncbi:MAG: sigma-54 dependent transcriptional regulator [Desulfohalobiaceae bacterium]
MTISKPRIIGESNAIQKVHEITRKVSNTDLNVLITGESGVGKEVVARNLHYYSKEDRPFIKVNCAALPTELLESELFGYEKGAFTGADKPKVGKFELAKDGTIFLDEIGELPLYTQATLLQVLQDQRFYRIGGNKEVEAQARVVAATNMNLDVELSSGNFRSDLYYRLSTISIHIPPLRERTDDIRPLTEHFIQHLQKQYDIEPLQLDSRLMDLFHEYYWPGNIRELENYLKRLSLLGNFDEIEEEIRYHQDKNTHSSGNFNDDVPQNHQTEESAPEEDVEGEDHFPSLKEVRDRAVQKAEKEIIERVLEETRWNRKEASRLLQISYRSLLYKMKDLDINPPKSRRRYQVQAQNANSGQNS